MQSDQPDDFKEEKHIFGLRLPSLRRDSLHHLIEWEMDGKKCHLKLQQMNMQKYLFNLLQGAYFSKSVGLDDPWRSLSTPTVLC